MNSKVKKKKPLSFIDQIKQIEDRRVFRLLNKAAGIPKMEISIHQCVFGNVLIATNSNYIKSIEFGKDSDECYRNFINRWANVSSFEVQDRKDFSIVDRVLKVIDTGVYDPSLNVSFGGAGTYFQHQVWEAIRTIEPGKTLSYKDIANKINHPKSFRAVGTACGANPIAVIVPCHRVVRSDGGEGGYRWGLDIKRKLLEREGSY